MARPIRTIRRSIRAAVSATRVLRYTALSGRIADDVASGRLVLVRDFLARIGGADLPDGKQSWFGRAAKKAFIAANGAAPVMVWAQHRTTGRFIHVCAYSPLDAALYEAVRKYAGTRHLLAADYARCA